MALLTSDYAQQQEPLLPTFSYSIYGPNIKSIC